MKLREVFTSFLKLGLTSFGGPVAHLGFFHDEFVKRKNWLTDESYSDLVAICQFLPGPASSQVGMSIGLLRAGYLGAIVAWAAFTLPSAAFMILASYGLNSMQGPIAFGILHGLKLVAVAVVAQAIWTMSRKMITSKSLAAIALVSTGAALSIQNVLMQVGVIVVSGLLGLVLTSDRERRATLEFSTYLSKRTAFVHLACFFLLLVLLPLLASASSSHALKLFDSFFRTGALVFGGGHVVLPLLEAEVVKPGWISQPDFVVGYGFAQAVPGPLFTFAAYLGSTNRFAPNGVAGGFLCLIAIFLPSLFLILGTLPFWKQLQNYKRSRSVMAGINAGVIGLLIAAFYHPVWTAAVFSLRDVLFAVAGFISLTYMRLPSWALVVLGAAVGAIVF